MFITTATVFRMLENTAEAIKHEAQRMDKKKNNFEYPSLANFLCDTKV